MGPKAIRAEHCCRAVAYLGPLGRAASWMGCWLGGLERRIVVSMPVIRLEPTTAKSHPTRCDLDTYNKTIVLHPEDAGPVRLPDQLGVTIEIVPIKELRSLSLSWCDSIGQPKTRLDPVSRIHIGQTDAQDTGTDSQSCVRWPSLGKTSAASDQHEPMSAHGPMATSLSLSWQVRPADAAALPHQAVRVHR